MQPVQVLNLYGPVLGQNGGAGGETPVDRIAGEGSADAGGEEAAALGGDPLAHLAGVVAEPDPGGLGVVPGEAALGERQRRGVRGVGVAQPGLAA